MRAKQMYPLCCLPLENTAIGDQSPEISTSGGIAGSESSTCFAGVLYKWTNYSKGWRSRWFVLRHGVLSYSKIHSLENFATLPENDVILIGDVSNARLVSSGSSRRKNTETGIIHLKVIIILLNPCPAYTYKLHVCKCLNFTLGYFSLPCYQIVSYVSEQLRCST